MRSYLVKMRGNGQSPPRASWTEMGWSWMGAFAGIALVGYLNARLVDRSDLMLLIGSFGASAVLLYGAPKSPLAQPRNVLGGHVLSALVGVSVRFLLPDPAWACAAVAVATAIALMHATGTLHPPGGATALIAVTGGPKVVALGYLFVLVPTGAGAVLLLVVALLVNNLARTRRYPEYWW
jgi:CBS-domain-containing membrane protein